MRKDEILWGILVLYLLLAFLSPLLPSLDKNGKTTVEIKTKLLSKQSFDDYKIDLSESKNGIEKIFIKKFNRFIVLVCKNAKNKFDGNESTTEEISEYDYARFDFVNFWKENEFEINYQLQKKANNIIKNAEKYPKKPIQTPTVKAEKEETVDMSNTLSSDNTENNDKAKQYRQRDKDYLNVCYETEKEYKEHPERFIDVSLYAVGDSSYRYYETKKGIEYNFASDGYGAHSLLEEDVFMLLNEQRFVKRKN